MDALTIKADSPYSGFLGLPIQGTDLICALGLHAVVLMCVFGKQPEVQPSGDVPVLMAEWISPPVAQAKPEKTVAQTLQPQSATAPAQIKPEPRRDTQQTKPAETRVKPAGVSVVSSSSAEHAQAEADKKPEPSAESKPEGKSEPKVESKAEARTEAKSAELKPSEMKSSELRSAESKPADIKPSDAKPVQAAFSPGAKTTLNPDYLAELFRKLARHKVYPAELKKNRVEGRVVVKFTLAADGRVMNSSIQQSSGHESLDAAALQMLNRASPLPAIPSWMNRSELTLAVPVEYSLLTDR